MRFIPSHKSSKPSGRNLNLIAFRHFSWRIMEDLLGDNFSRPSPYVQHPNVEEHSPSCGGLLSQRSSLDQPSSSHLTQRWKTCREECGRSMTGIIRGFWTSTPRMSNSEGEDEERERKLLEFDQTLLDGGSKHRVIKIDSAGTWQNMVVSSLDLVRLGLWGIT